MWKTENEQFFLEFTRTHSLGIGCVDVVGLLSEHQSAEKHQWSLSCRRLKIHLGIFSVVCSCIIGNVDCHTSYK